MIEKIFERVVTSMDILDPIVKWMQEISEHPDWNNASESLKELQSLLETAEKDFTNLLILARMNTDDKDLHDEFMGIVEPFFKEFTQLRLKITEQLALGDVGMNQAIFAAGLMNQLCKTVMWHFMGLSDRMRNRIAN